MTVLVASAFEAYGAALAAYDYHQSWGDGVAAWFLAFGLLGLLLVPCAAGLGALVQTEGVRRLGWALVGGFGGERKSAPLALVVLLVACAGAFGVSLVVGQVLVERLSPSFGAAGTGAFALLSFATISVVLAALVPLWNALVERLEQRSAGLGIWKASWVVFFVGTAAAGWIGAGLGTAYLYFPLGLALGLAWSLGESEGPLARWLSPNRRSVWLAVGSVLLFVPAAVFPHHAPPAAQGAVLYKAPYLSVMVATVERATDQDGDGYSTLLFGKDCDDANPKVFPGAMEIANNGIDENCSGRDSEEYEPIRPPETLHLDELPPKMNVLMIMVDALRPDRLHFAGYERETSPHIDEFRKDATWFKNAFTTGPQTRDALASLFTAKYPFRLDITMSRGNATLPERHQTFAEMLSKRGYDTLGYTITFVDKRFRGYGQGFSSFAAPWGPKPWNFEWKRAAPLTTKAALKQLEIQSDQKPWLLFLHYRCTHDPYYVREKDFGKTNSDKYDSGIHHCDSNIAPVLKAAARRPDADRTAIILFSDHGELFGEHGGHYHAETLFEPDVRMLLLAKIPGATQSTVEVPVNIADLGASVMALSEREVPRGVDGWNLLPLAYGATPDRAWSKRPLFTMTDLWRANIHYAAASVIQYPEKYIWDMRTGMKKLYNVADDPLELSPLQDEQKKARMSLLLEQWLGSVAPPDFGVEDP